MAWKAGLGNRNMQKTVLADGSPFQVQSSATAPACHLRTLRAGRFAGHYGGATLVFGLRLAVIPLAAGAEGALSGNSSQVLQRRPADVG